jgi:prepilin-type N-terminal cleavage/methylation domain-containing protein
MSNYGPRAQAGVGLIEVLVSLLVLSIGMLGLAGLQIYSLHGAKHGRGGNSFHRGCDARRSGRGARR